MCVRLQGRSLRRRSRRITGGKRRRVHISREKDSLVWGDGERSAWGVSTVEQALIEGGRQYSYSGAAAPLTLGFPPTFSLSNSEVLCCCSWRRECAACTELYKGTDLPFCLQCLPHSTRQMLRQVLLICLDGMASLVLQRFHYSKSDKWRRWLAVRLHRDQVAGSSVWEQQEASPADPSKKQLADVTRSTHPPDMLRGEETQTDSVPALKRPENHTCWGELIPYLNIFWPFVEHQESPANLDLCVVSELLQQLHALAAEQPQRFKSYPLASEAARYGGDFAAANAAVAASSWREASDELSSESQ
ncbi:uncharacterized protein LOC113146961 [Cyclospora cayetanensis]|uniref:Uncharacterized protein LOC113146961 n=1 Tax=Cyclospora cayetanensis TaxID=88456 RepID=A0A6P6RVZ7_9EIME|nr:uncharacterized protein LOC113146961 [Cyclospora cayetanensis]